MPRHSFHKAFQVPALQMKFVKKKRKENSKKKEGNVPLKFRKIVVPGKATEEGEIQHDLAAILVCTGTSQRDQHPIAQIGNIPNGGILKQKYILCRGSER